MGHICWGVEGAREELKRLVSKEEKIVLNVVETPHQAGRFFYELRIQPDAAIVDLGSAFKNCAPRDAKYNYADEHILRRCISNILHTPHPCYQRNGEKVLAGLGLGRFSENADKKHLSPRDELTLIHATLECAQIIGFNRIPYIGRTETNHKMLQQALEELADRKKDIAGRYEVLR